MFKLIIKKMGIHIGILILLILTAAIIIGAVSYKGLMSVYDLKDVLFTS